MTDIIDRMRTDLQVAAETLRRYEALHLAKGTPESLEKANVNAALAARLEATLREVNSRLANGRRAIDAALKSAAKLAQTAGRMGWNSADDYFRD